MRMKYTQILSLAALGALSSCSLFDSDYAAYKREKAANAGNQAADGAYAAANPYTNPNLPAETGTYTPTSPGGGYDNSTPYYGDESGSSSYTPSAGGQTSSHTVVKGDTLWGISRKYNVGVEAIKSANSLTSDTIVVGRTLVIPAR